MIKYENDCCSCGLYCKGTACPNYSVPHFYCDECGNEDELYDYDDKQLCRTCLLNSIPKVRDMERM